jgi:IS5 family transposase
VRLVEKIDWPRFDADFADSYSEDLGAPGKAIRLMVGPQYLKYTFNESDESLVERWVENRYWQYYCGFTHMPGRSPRLARWRPASLTKSITRWPPS